MHYTKAKSILSPNNGMNLYRGCQHGCIYCDSRSKCYQMNHAFEDIEVKENALELLREALKAKRRRCMIGTGAMTDPYIPLERELKMTRGALELIDEYGFGIAIQTKSADILRDLDVLQRINRRARAVVQMTVTTFDDTLCRILEPNVSPTSQRLAALRRFRDAGIPTVVWLSPILPYINDTRENITAILDSCIDAGVAGILCFGMGVTLRDGNREYFYRCLDAHFPGMKQRYIRDFGNRYELLSPNNRELMQLFHETCNRAGIGHDPSEIFAFLRRFEETAEASQLCFFD